MNTLIWLIRRELWENRAVWIIPAALGVVLTLAALFGRVEVPSAATPAQDLALGGFVLFGFGAVFFLVMTLYSTWYLLDCLYADREDRSVLFWKSLPISDAATVLAKLLTAVVVIPLVYFLAADASTLLLVFIVSVRAHGTLGGALWRPELWLQMQVLWLYLIATTALWYLPFSGWLLVVSAWAKRAVMLWSLLPPLALLLLERWFLHGHFIADALLERLQGYFPRAFHGETTSAAWSTLSIDGDSLTLPRSVWRWLDPRGFFLAPSTWVGVLMGAALIYAAVQLRLRRAET